jgi:hypothetical protein
MLSDVSQITFIPTLAQDQDSYVFGNLVIIMCCAPGIPPQPTTGFNQCPAGTTEVSTDDNPYLVDVTVNGPSENDTNPLDIFEDLPVDLDEDDDIVIKQNCPDNNAVVMEMSFKVEGAEEVTITFIGPGGEELISITKTPTTTDETIITISPFAEGVAEIVLQVESDGSGYSISELFILMCCGPAPPTTTTPIQCPEGGVLVTTDDGPLTVNIDLPNGSPYPTPSDIFEDEPVELPGDSTIIVTELCADGETTVMSISFTIENAVEVTVTISGESGVIETFPMVLLNDGSLTSINIPAMVSGATQITIVVELVDGEDFFKISDLRLVLCCYPAVPTTTPGQCVFDMAAYVEQFGTVPDSEDVIGYIEKDNIPGWSSPEETVSIGDVIEPGTVVHIDCNNCTCDEDTGITCTNEDCETDCVWTAWSPWVLHRSVRWRCSI